MDRRSRKVIAFVPVALLVFGLLIGAAYLFIYGGTQVQSDTADRRGETAERERVRADGDRRVAITEQFYNRCADIQSQNEKLENYRDQLELAEDEDTRERIQSGILATENTRSENIAEYNAASADANRGYLRDDGLPVTIDEDDTELECGA